jgi:hypothetical protein
MAQTRERSNRTRVVLVISTLLLVVAPSIARADGRLPREGTVVGAYVQDNAGGSLVDAQRRFERMIDDTLRATRVFLRWDSSFPNDQVRWLKRKNRIIVLSVRAVRQDGSLVPWASIAAAEPGSDTYSVMTEWARGIRAFDRHIYFIFNHEPEAAANSSLGSSADFVAAWRKLVQVFRQERVRNVSWTWTMTDWAFQTTDERAANNWYPGDDYVDVIGADLYNSASCSSEGMPWRTFREKLKPIRAWARMHPGKPIILPEWASTEDPAEPGRKAAWLREARDLLKLKAWHLVRMVMYFQTINPAKPACHWPVDSSDSSLRAFSALANDRFFT